MKEKMEGIERRTTKSIEVRGRMNSRGFIYVRGEATLDWVWEECDYKSFDGSAYCGGESVSGGKGCSSIVGLEQGF